MPPREPAGNYKEYITVYESVQQTAGLIRQADERRTFVKVKKIATILPCVNYSCTPLAIGFFLHRDPGVRFRFSIDASVIGGKCFRPFFFFFCPLSFRFASTFGFFRSFTFQLPLRYIDRSFFFFYIVVIFVLILLIS